MSEMNKKELRILKLLGYESTKESGAVLEHPQLWGLDKYVWDDDNFVDVLKAFAGLIQHDERRRLAYLILNS